MTGVTLPLVSYGGSSVMSTLLMLGIIQGLYILEKTRMKKLKDIENSGEKSSGVCRKPESMKQKKSRNREYTFVSWFFVLIFVSMIGYLIYFNAVKARILSIVRTIPDRIPFPTG